VQAKKALGAVRSKR